jgi:hypothetical protein
MQAINNQAVKTHCAVETLTLSIDYNFAATR